MPRFRGMDTGRENVIEAATGRPKVMVEGMA
jgi:hypothetical protein